MDDRDKGCEYVNASEQEWRRILYNKIEKLEDKLSRISEWTLVFRIMGAAAFALLVAYVESRIK